MSDSEDEDVNDWDSDDKSSNPAQNNTTSAVSLPIETDIVSERATDIVSERATDIVSERKTDIVSERKTDEVSERKTDEVSERKTGEVSERKTDEVLEKKTTNFWEREPEKHVLTEVLRYVDLYLFIVAFEHYKDDLSKILEHFDVNLLPLAEFKESRSIVNNGNLVEVYRMCKKRVLPRVMIKTGDVVETEDPWSIRSNYKLWSGYPLYNLPPLASLESIHIKNGYKLYPYNYKKIEYQIPEVICERFYTFIKSCIDIAKQQNFKRGTSMEIKCKNDNVLVNTKRRITGDTYKLVSNENIQYNFPRLKLNISGYFFEDLQDVENLPLGTIRYKEMTAKYYLFKDMHVQGEDLMKVLRERYGKKDGSDFTLDMERGVRDMTSTIDSKDDDVKIVYSRSGYKFQNDVSDSCYLQIRLKTSPVHRREIIGKIINLCV